MKTFPVYLIYGMPVYQARIQYPLGTFDGVINGAILRHCVIDPRRLENTTNDN